MNRAIDSARAPGRAVANGTVAVMLMVVAGPSAADSKTVPAEFQGKWVPAKAACESPVTMLVEAKRLTLVNGKDSEALGGIEMAGPGFFPPGYRGIMAVLITEFDGQQPASVTFNNGEKKGAALIEFSHFMPGKPTSAYNARITKLNLAKRFPLHQVPLKKCAGAGGAAKR